MHRLDGRWVRGSDRSQWALAEVRPQWQLAAVRTFIFTQRESALSKTVWEVWQRGVAAPWLNGNYVRTSASGCGWTTEFDRSGRWWCHLWDTLIYRSCAWFGSSKVHYCWSTSLTHAWFRGIKEKRSQVLVLRPFFFMYSWFSKLELQLFSWLLIITFFWLVYEIVWKSWSMPITISHSSKWHLQIACFVQPTIQNQKIFGSQRHQTVKSSLSLQKLQPAAVFWFDKRLNW